MVTKFEDRFLFCCGRGGGGGPGGAGGKTAKTTALRTQPTTPAAGQVLVRYTGTRAADAPFYGSVSRKQYRFGRGADLGYVDAVDVDALLALRGMDSFERVAG